MDLPSPVTTLYPRISAVVPERKSPCSLTIFPKHRTHASQRRFSARSEEGIFGLFKSKLESEAQAQPLGETAALANWQSSLGKLMAAGIYCEAVVALNVKVIANSRHSLATDRATTVSSKRLWPWRSPFRTSCFVASPSSR